MNRYILLIGNKKIFILISSPSLLSIYSFLCFLLTLVQYYSQSLLFSKFDTPGDTLYIYGYFEKNFLNCHIKSTVVKLSDVIILTLEKEMHVYVEKNLKKLKTRVKKVQ